MLFVFPHFLWLLLLAPALAWLNWRATSLRRAASSTLRFLCIATLVLALADPLVPARTKSSTHIAVVDLGPGAADSALNLFHHFLHSKDSQQIRRVIAFSNRAELLDNASELDNPAALAALKHRLDQPIWIDDPANGGANLPAALQLAGAQIPAESHGDVHLFASGHANHGDAAAEAYRLAERGIAVIPTAATTFPIDLPACIVRKVELPSTAQIGQTLSAQVEIECSSACAANVRLSVDHADPVMATANLSPGLNRIKMDLPVHQHGMMFVHAGAWTSAQTAPPQDNLAAAVYVQAAPCVLLVQDHLEAGESSALKALLGESADLVAVTPEQLDQQSIENAGAIVLADLPADRVSTKSQSHLQQAVTSGTGLFITGAARSFGPGGYDDSQLASVIPVRMSQPMQNIEPSTTLVLIIDTSGSMTGAPVDLAKEVARLAIAHLRPHDKVGLVEFYGGRRWAAPLDSVGDGAVINRALERLTAGGGTVLYPAVEEAAFALRNVHTRSKHVFILSDGGVEEAPFAAIARQMNEDGIAVSTIQCGPGDGTPNNPMPDIARWGGGRYYMVPDQFALPDISFKQPQMSFVSPLVKNPSAILAGEDALTRGSTPDAFGNIDGYVRTQAKPMADVLLKTTGGDPLLVRWRQGAGFVAAMPTQLGSAMTQNLENKQPFATLISSLLRQIDSGRTGPLRIESIVRPAGVEIEAAAVDRNAGSDDLPIEVTFADEKGAALRQIQSEAVAPGHWDLLLPGVTSGAYTISAKLVGGSQAALAAVAVPMPRALDGLKFNESLLHSLGSFSSLAATRAAVLPDSRTVLVDWRNWLAAAAILLLLAHVAVRRWPVQIAKGLL